MDKEHIQLNEQEAPEKNTDAAFVKVNSDGKPVMEPNTSEQASQDNGPKEGTLADR
jgi:hypothetical protein